jgi:hypothetical protein
MTECRFTWRSQSYVLIEGEMSGNGAFQEVFSQPQSDLWLDMGGVTRVNSLGVHNWVKSVSKFRGSIHYVNVPMCVLEQFSCIPEFRGRNADIGSFWAVYSCEHCHKDETMLLVVGKDIQPGLPVYDDAPSLNCPTCGCTMFFDHDPQATLSFFSDMKLPQIYGEGV